MQIMVRTEQLIARSGFAAVSYTHLGAALAHLQKELGISPDETMAFGDYYNDAGFLARASYSFVMENADEEMRKYGNFTAPPNTQYGVIRTIRRYVLEGETLPSLPDECI